MPRWSHESQAWSALSPERPSSTRYLTPALLDSAVTFGRGDDPGGSVLLLPTGAALLLDDLCKATAPASSGRMLVIAAPGVRYDSDRPRESIRVVQREALGQALSGCETGDYLLLVEPRYWPLTGYDFEWIVRQSQPSSGATYVVAVGRDDPGARERVECDGQGRVQRVQRLYSRGGWTGPGEGKVICAVVPGRALQGVPFESLADLRNRLAGRGLLTRDLPVPSDVADLTTPAGVLALAEQALDVLLDGPAEGLRAIRPGVLAGSGCRVAPTARLIGPAVLQDGAVLEAGATVVGPAIVGAGARVGAGAVVARSVMLAGASVADGTGVCSEIISGRRSDEAAGAEAPGGHASARALDSCVSRHLVVADLPRQQRSRRRRLELAIKRGLDVALAGIGLLALAPILLAAAALVKASSPGPLFFIHRREGRGGREFGCLKFRTMVPDAHRKQREMYAQNQVDGPQFKIDKDPRVTRIGAILRRTNIDELPQLFNVLAGQMSLVGPRPSPFRENQICVPWRLARLSVRPGITGVWQICRDRRSEGDFHQWIYYDLAYVKHFSLWLDVKILWYTLTSRGGRNRVPVECLVPAMAETKPLRDEGPCSC